MKKICLIFIFLVATSEVCACFCDSVKSIKEEVLNRDLIIKGVVLSLDTLVSVDTIHHKKSYSIFYPVQLLIKVKVTHVFKGNVVDQTINIVTGFGNGEGDCGFNFDKGTEYIIYGTHMVVARLEATFFSKRRARRDKYVEKLKCYVTHECTRTRKADQMEERKLKEFMVPLQLTTYR